MEMILFQKEEKVKLVYILKNIKIEKKNMIIL